MGAVSSTATDTVTVGTLDVLGKSHLDASSFVRLFDNNLKSSNWNTGRPNPRLTGRFPDHLDPPQLRGLPKRVGPGRYLSEHNQAAPRHPDPR
jgi:hypothetical protein